MAEAGRDNQEFSSLPDFILDPFEHILLASRALLALASPEPFEGAGNAARTLLAPENRAQLKPYHADVCTTIRGHRLWNGLVDDYWGQAVADNENAAAFTQSMTMASHEEIDPEELLQVASKISNWVKVLRPHATDRLAARVEHHATKLVKPLLERDRQVDRSNTKEKLQLASKVFNCLGPSISNRCKALARDTATLIKELQELDNELLTACQSFDGSRFAIATVRAALNAVGQGALSEEILDTVCALRAQLLDQALLWARDSTNFQTNMGHITSIKELLELAGTLRGIQDREAFCMDGQLEDGINQNLTLALKVYEDMDNVQGCASLNKDEKLAAVLAFELKLANWKKLPVRAPEQRFLHNWNVAVTAAVEAADSTNNYKEIKTQVITTVLGDPHPLSS